MTWAAAGRVWHYCGRAWRNGAGSGPSPCDYLQEDAGAEWPRGPFDEDAPEVLDFYLGMVERLKAACKDAKDSKEEEGDRRDRQRRQGGHSDRVQHPEWQELVRASHHLPAREGA